MSSWNYWILTVSVSMVEYILWGLWENIHCMECSCKACMEGTQHHPQVSHWGNLWVTPSQGDVGKSVHWFCELPANKYKILHQSDGQLTDEGHEDSDGQDHHQDICRMFIHNWVFDSNISKELHDVLWCTCRRRVEDWATQGDPLRLLWGSRLFCSRNWWNQVTSMHNLAYADSMWRAVFLLAYQVFPLHHHSTNYCSCTKLVLS